MIAPNHLGEHDPRRKAVQVLVDCTVDQPPVDEQRICDYFLAKIDRTPFSEVQGCANLARQSDRLPSGMLIPAKADDAPVLWVDPAASPGRFRWTVFHELGHLDLEHDGPVFTDNDSTLRQAEGRAAALPTEYREVGQQATLFEADDGPDRPLVPVFRETSDSLRRKHQEREANLYASEMIMPSQLFVPEARLLPTGIEAIQDLRDRYRASFEATAIRYAQACPDKCAVLAAEPAGDAQGNLDGFTVLYVLRGPRGFLSGLNQGARLPFSGLLAQAWSAESKRHVEGIITADSLGLDSHLQISADALRLGNFGRVIALLWLESRQLSLAPAEA